MFGKTPKESVEKTCVFADILQLYLRRVEISQSQLAEAIFVRANTVSQWVTGDRIPGDSNIVHSIAATLGLSEQEKDALLSAFTVDSLMRVNQDYMDNASTRDLHPLNTLIDMCQNTIQKVHSEYRIQRRRWVQ